MPLVRAINSVMRARIDTMDELICKTPEELAKIRNAGAKSLELIYLLREKYAQETGKCRKAHY
jgi:DNA-directed RNA polymerase alpha subunit